MKSSNFHSDLKFTLTVMVTTYLIGIVISYIQGNHSELGWNFVFLWPFYAICWAIFVGIIAAILLIPLSVAAFTWGLKSRTPYRISVSIFFALLLGWLWMADGLRGLND